MNHDTDLPAALRMQLRGLREDIAPPAHVWDAIDARLDMPRAARRTEPRRWPLALAATLGAVALAGAWTWSSLREHASPSVVASDALPASADPGMRDAIAALDRDARTIRAALREDPDSRVLLQQLHRVDAIRHILVQRAALG